MSQDHGFELVREQHIPELNTEAQIYRHVKTGAELLSLHSDDENKVFGITFRTPPTDSTGVAHILEHSVLCGSRKYPIKEPFVELLKGSLKTFLNAFTYPDKTCYPVASTNLQDFYNLVDVYLDAVFYPRITPQILQQEGWHYELEDRNEPLTYKGVVFNEMKGAYSSPDSMLYRYSQQSLFPDTTYGVSSGGDPTAIPDLTYEQFKQFHDTLYHPSNARIFFYGDDPTDERLRLLDAYLSEFEPITPPSEIDLQQPFDEPRQTIETYSVTDGDAAEKKGMVTINWMLGEERDTETTLALDILSQIILGTAGAPLRKALIDSGLGEDLTGSGYNDGMRQHAFSVGMKGINPDDAEKVQTLVFDTLRRLADEGIDPDDIAAAMNTTEFALRENNTGSFPRGLALMLRSLGTWLYDGDPLAPLAFEAPLAAVKARLEQGDKLFEHLIREFLLENQHRTLVVLRPDPAFAERQAEAERNRLDAVRAAMDDEALTAVIETTEELKRMQETPDTPEALASVPSLALDDLDKQQKQIPVDISDDQGVTVLHHDLFTNGIVYLSLAFDMHTLPQELLPYVPLFGRALTEMGTTSEDFVRLQQRIGRSTGGIGASPLVTTMRNGDSSAARLIVSGKATMGQTDDLLAILRDLLLTVNLDNPERFRQMVLRSKAGKESGLVPSGHTVVGARLSARFSEASWASEQMSGISNLFFLRDLARTIDEDWSSVLQRLEAIRTHLLQSTGLVVNVTLDGDNWRGFAPKLRAFLGDLPSGDATQATWTPETPTANEGLTIPAQVNYVGKGANLYTLGYSYHASAAVITRFLRTSWLWEKVRVQGGAYGGFCSFDRNSGAFNYLSYRDPNLLKTLDVYDQTSAFLRQSELGGKELTRSIIGAIGDRDAYQLPDAKGYTSLVRYLTGVTDEALQQSRDEILGTSADDFRAFADVLDAVRDQGQVVVMGSQGAIEAANVEHTGMFNVTKVL